MGERTDVRGDAVVVGGPAGEADKDGRFHILWEAVRLLLPPDLAKCCDDPFRVVTVNSDYLGIAYCESCHRGGSRISYEELCLRSEVETLRRENKILTKKVEAWHRLPFCADHRDKVAGQPCRECEIEAIRRAHAALSSSPTGSATPTEDADADADAPEPTPDQREALREHEWWVREARARRLRSQPSQETGDAPDSGEREALRAEVARLQGHRIVRGDDGLRPAAEAPELDRIAVSDGPEWWGYLCNDCGMPWSESHVRHGERMRVRMVPAGEPEHTRRLAPQLDNPPPNRRAPRIDRRSDRTGASDE